MKLEKLSIDGKKDTIEVLDKIFSAKVNSKLVSSVLYKTNANYKGRHAKTKQQNEVSGSTYFVLLFCFCMSAFVISVCFIQYTAY